MKKTENSLFYLVVILMVAVMAMALSSCTETIYEELLITKTDTVVIDKTDTLVLTDTVFLDKMLLRVDTIKMNVVTTDVDTVFQVITDSVFIYTTLYETIFITEIRHIYHDTLFIPIGWSTTSLGAYEPSVAEFYNLAIKYGRYAPGGDVIIEQWIAAEAPPASRSSYSFYYYDQFILKIKESLTPEEAYTSILREMAHWQLGKPYSTNPNEIMSPDFDWRRLKLSSTDAQKKPFLDKLFAN